MITMTLGIETTTGSRKFEGPQEVVSLLEVRTNGHNFVDQIFHTDNVVLAKSLFNDAVICEGDSLLLNFAETSLVHKLTDCLQIRIAVSNVGFNLPEHVDGGLVQLNKDNIVQLSETEKLENLLCSGIDVGNTLNADNASKLSLGLNEEVTAGAGISSEADEGSLSSAVLLNVLLSALEHGLSAQETSLLLSGNSSNSFLSELLVSVSLLENGLRNSSRLCGSGRSSLGGGSSFTFGGHCAI